MADKFDDAVAKLTLVALHKTPVVNIITEIVESFLPESPDERLKAALVAEEAARVERLDQRVLRLEAVLARVDLKLDDLGPTRTVNVAREFVRGCTESVTEGKVEALINAAARQFDPRVKDRAVRAYWFRRVRSLSDLELVVLRFFAKYEKGAQFSFVTFDNYDKQALHNK